MKKAFFIINPKSGKRNYLEIKKLIERYAASECPGSRVKVWEDKDQLAELMEEAKAGDYKTIFAVGGDGTVHGVGKHLIGTEFNLGIIPNGSGDGIARHFRIPQNPIYAMALLKKGVVQRIDTGLVNEQIPFIGFMGTGLDAKVAHLFSSLKRRGFLPYLKLALAEYFKHQTERYKVFIEGQEPFELRPQVLCVGNTSQFGNGAYFSPGASATDGSLELCKMDPIPNLKLPLVIYKIFNATCHQLKGYQRWQFEKLCIEREGEDFGHVDGEAIRTGKKFCVRIQKKSLNLLIPPLNTPF